MSAPRALSASEITTCRADDGELPRPASAARIAIAASFPAMRSASATPDFIGAPFGSPVIAIHPDSACTTKSYPGRLLVRPKPVIVHHTSRGDASMIAL